jgi:uncharacterized repeat protein (TIGR01451 family)
MVSLEGYATPSRYFFIDKKVMSKRSLVSLFLKNFRPSIVALAFFCFGSFSLLGQLSPINTFYKATRPNSRLACTLNVNVSDIICEDMGTADPSDDTYDFTLTVTATDAPPGSSWTSNNLTIGSGNYDEPKVFTQMFSIASGDIFFQITDTQDPNCFVDVSVTPPAACSPACTLQMLVNSVSCDTQGTPSTSDDEIVLSISMSGTNGLEWTLSRQVNENDPNNRVALGSWTDDQTVTVRVNTQQATAGYAGQLGFGLHFGLEGYDDCSGDEFIESPSCPQITVSSCAKPNAGSDVAFCSPRSTVDLIDATSGQEWTADNTFNPLPVTIDATTGVVNNMLVDGVYRFILGVTGNSSCADTVLVTRKQKPVASPDLTGNNAVCAPVTFADLNSAPATDVTWSVGTGAPSSNTTIDNTGNVSNMDANGTYTFVVTFNGCTDTTLIERKACTPSSCNKPNAGADITVCEPTRSVDLPDAGPNQLWIFGSGNPANASIISSSGTVSGMTANGTYMFVLQASETCSDTVLVIRRAKPNAGTDVSICVPTNTTQLSPVTTGGTWTAASGNPSTGASVSVSNVASGLTAPGSYRFVLTVNGCTDTVAVARNAQPTLSDDLTGANALCSNVSSTTLTASPTGGTWTALTGNAAAAVVSSTGNVTGLSANGFYRFSYTGPNGCADTVTIERKDCTNPPCVRPNAGADLRLCRNTQTADLPDGVDGQTWAVVANNPSNANINANTGAVTGMVQNGTYRFVLTAPGTGTNCSDTVTIIKGVIEYENQSVCAPLTTFQLPAAQTGQTWSALAGNPTAATVNNSGSVANMSTNGLYRFVISDGTCSDTVVIERKTCTAQVDLALRVRTSNRTPALNDVITYTITVLNKGTLPLTGIEVTDTLNAGLSLQNASVTRGGGAFNSSTKIWNLGGLAAGDSAILVLTVRVVQAGLWFNVAEVTKLNETDVNSTPNNGVFTEDDIDRSCISSQITICNNQKVVLTVPQGATNIQWFRDGQAISGAISASYDATQTGNYTYTATANGCSINACCGFNLLVENCCPTNLCLPFLVQKTR